MGLSGGLAANGGLGNGARGPFSLMRTYGHSIAAGGGASGMDSCGSTVVGSYFSVPDVLNLGIGGSFLGRDSADGTNGGVSWIAQRERRVIKRAPYAAALDLCLLHYGYEDIQLGNSSTAANPVGQNQSIFKNALRTALSIVRSSARFYAGDKTTNLDASIVLGTAANWTVVANPAALSNSGIPAAVSGSVGYVTTTTNGAGGAVTITIPGDYPGSAVCPLACVFVADPTTTAGTITASGAATGTFDLVQQVAGGTPSNTSGTCDAVNSRKSLVTMRFTGSAIAASNGVTQTLTLTPSALAGGTWGLAEWLIEAQTPPAIAIPVPGDGAYGNPNILTFQGIRNSDVVAFNALIQSLVTSEFNDGTVFVSQYTLGGSGNVLGLGGTLANAAAATVVSATGFGGATATNCQLTSVADPLAGPSSVVNGTQTWALMVGSEVVTFTGRTGSTPTWTLTGTVRGAYNTTAAAHAANPIFDLLNISALPNHSSDAVHPADVGHGVIGQAVINSLRTQSLDPVAPTQRVRARAKIYAVYKGSWTQQVIANQGSGLGPTLTALNWDQVIVDSASMMRTFNNVVLNTYSAVTIPASGLYAFSTSGVVTAGRAINGGGSSAATAGLFGFILQRNGGTVGWKTLGSFAAADFPNAVFTWGVEASFPQVECYVGDTVQLSAFQSGVGVSTTVTDNPLASGATTINLAATAGMTANDVLRIENEAILIGTVASGTQLTGCTRGYQGTTAAAHASGKAAFTGRGVYGTTSGGTPAVFVVERRAAL